MKKVLLIALALSLIVAGAAVASVVSSKHDMRFENSSKAQNNATAVCEFCHHPHRGVSNFTNALIWNKKVANTTAIYSPYVDTATLTATPAAVSMNGNLNSNGLYATALCMSCHDSANASNGIVRPVRGMGTSATLTIIYNEAAANLGTTLADDHPVNFQYTDDASDDIPTADYATMKLATSYQLYDSYFQCATCHDVHAGDNSVSSQVQFMRGDTIDSAICRDCHTNK